MTITNLTIALDHLRALDAIEGGIPAGAMHHVTSAMERIERKIESIKRTLAAAEAEAALAA